MAAFPGDIRTISLNETTLAYAERGQGEPLIFVHGTSQDMRTWSGQLDAFAREYRTISYSRRYARPNEDIPAGHDDPMQTHVDDLIALLHAVGAAPAHLVGNSWGGFISLLTAIKAPDSVKTLTLCEAPVLTLVVDNNPKPAQIMKLLLRNPADAARLIRFGMRVSATQDRYRKNDIAGADRIFGTALLGKAHYESLPEDRRRMLHENASVEAAQMLGAGFPPLSADDVRNVKAPTLLVTGDASAPLLRITLTNALQRLLPHVERVTIPGASHIMHEDDPATFNEAVLAFLRRSRR
jgi:pimeloyl-ACP methyl ester carboxylesterase